MTRPSALVLALGLALASPGCGDSPATPYGSGEQGGKGGKALTPAELAGALQGAGANPDALKATLEQTMKETAARMGGDLVETARKAKALGERPLTGDDVERYLAVYPKVKAVSGKPSEMTGVLVAEGLSVPEWSVLAGRMMALRFALKLPADKVDPKMAADVETVRPYADRLEAAHKSP